ncbi:MAG: NADH-quinone oxidoreductase subunit L [Ekhidna sp.]
MNDLLLVTLVLFIPLLGGLIGSIAKKYASTISTGSIAIAFTLSVVQLVTLDESILFNWNWTQNISLGILVDQVASLLIVLVTFISLLVHVFSLEYMKEDSGKSRYFAKLGFFTFSMIGLLIADHLILLFVFWELVGLASYLLIGFWYSKDQVSSSARMAFMVNRVADVALLGGILLLSNTQSLSISEFNGVWLFVPSLLIAIGAFGKSAQLPFSGWLTKAMVGPTPVSALIHAATMVAAGVYLLFRTAPFFPQEVFNMIALVGIFTAFYGAICALTQHDIKKVLAYSTISQLGYMVMGIGVGAGEASLFHLWTHGFFKAGLFLGAGSIIHFLHQTSKQDAQDMRLMGGLKSTLPWTYRSFLVCGLALAGLPLFSGFMSKEGIIIASWVWASEVGTWAYLVSDLAFITAFLTAFYVGRMISLVFFGESRVVKEFLAFTESRKVAMPLMILAIGSFWFVYHWNPFSHSSWIYQFIGDQKSTSDSFISLSTTIISFFLATGGLILAYFLFRPKSNYIKQYQQLGEPSSKMGRLVFNGFYFTKFYEHVGVGVLRLGKTFSFIDQQIIDRILHFVAILSVVLGKTVSVIDRFFIDGIINGVAWFSIALGERLAGVNAREIQTQLIWLLLGIILILGYILLF